MKLLSIAIPCYNSQDYMESCIESLLVGGEEVEILIVDDGSSDRTAEIADDYARKYPTIVKAIHQENGGHGEAVNAGIRNATGLYFKVVDSDDWVNKEAYVQILKTLYELLRGPQTVDLLISNFVYEKQGATRKKIMQYRKCLPQDRIFGWEEVKHMPKGKYLLMHSMIYRTKLLHECNLELPKHTFYVDNLFAFEPLPYVQILKTLYELLRGPQTVDLLISNFVYEKQGATRKKIMQYRKCLPQDRIFGWEEVKHMPKGKYLLMHSMIYRTKLLHECNLELPKHTFYVDNLFAFEPLPYVKNLYYLDVNFYRYFIGRDDQSVNEKVMIKRIDQQIRVNKLMVDAYINCKNTNKQLKAYMFSYLDIITTISSIMLIRANTEESLQKKKELLEYIRTENKQVYRKLRHSLFGRVMNLPGRGGRKMSVAAYKISQKFYGFN